MKLALALVLLVACGGAQRGPSAPSSAGVERYLAALRADDARAAYALLSDELRGDLSYDEFARDWKASAPERAAQAAALEEALRADPSASAVAELTYGDGRKVVMRFEDGAWQLQSALVSRTHASRPHDAVEMFVRALDARSFEGVMRVLTARRRDGIAAQLDGFSRSLEAHLADAEHEIYLVGDDRAELSWNADGVTYKLVLRREQGEWRIDDVHILPLAPEPDPEPGDDEGGAEAERSADGG